MPVPSTGISFMARPFLPPWEPIGTSSYTSRRNINSEKEKYKNYHDVLSLPTILRLAFPTFLRFVRHEIFFPSFSSSFPCGVIQGKFTVMLDRGITGGCLDLRDASNLREGKQFHRGACIEARLEIT